MNHHQEPQEMLKDIIRISRYAMYIALLALSGIVLSIYALNRSSGERTVPVNNKKTASAHTEGGAKALMPVARVFPADSWKAPNESTIPKGKEGETIRYGKALIAHTAVYLGPKGKVARISNGMNCQNCHNEAGTKLYGLNYAAVAATYPQFKARSNKIVSIAERINGCFQRSLNGKPLDTASEEMQAMIAYMKWLGRNVPKGQKPAYTAVEKLAFLDRAADPARGKVVFAANCQSCHGANGQGLLNTAGNEFIYPPLWGENSYNDGAGLYRIGNFAGFVKNNMPFGVNYEHPVLTDEEAWDVAAFVNAQERPHKDQSEDWKDLAKKPLDLPVGPYVDGFSEQQHKYGPFQPIAEALKHQN